MIALLLFLLRKLNNYLMLRQLIKSSINEMSITEHLTQKEKKRLKRVAKKLARQLQLVTKLQAKRALPDTLAKSDEERKETMKVLSRSVTMGTFLFHRMMAYAVAEEFCERSGMTIEEAADACRSMSLEEVIEGVPVIAEFAKVSKGPTN